MASGLVNQTRRLLVCVFRNAEVANGNRPAFHLGKPISVGVIISIFARVPSVELTARMGIL